MFCVSWDSLGHIIRVGFSVSTSLLESIPRDELPVLRLYHPPAVILIIDSSRQLHIHPLTTFVLTACTIIPWHRFLLGCAFEEVHVCKPASSTQGNAETYIVAKWYVAIAIRCATATLVGRSPSSNPTYVHYVALCPYTHLGSHAARCPLDAMSPRPTTSHPIRCAHPTSAPHQTRVVQCTGAYVTSPA